MEQARLEDKEAMAELIDNLFNNANQTPDNENSNVAIDMNVEVKMGG